MLVINIKQQSQIWAFFADKVKTKNKTKKIDANVDRDDREFNLHIQTINGNVS